MTNAYVILAHKYPGQLDRLVRALDDGKSVFFIHVDKGADLKEFELKSERVQFIARVKSTWASFGLVQATLNGLRAAHDSGHSFTHVILLSGQDYPIKSNTQINRFLASHADSSFIEFHHLPAPARWEKGGGLFRVNKYFFGLRPWQLFSSRTVNFLSGYLPFIKRRMYKDMEPYAGSMWWILNMEAVRYVLNFVQQNPGYSAFHRYTFAVDEVFFQTILLNAKDEKLEGRIVNADKRFIKWKNSAASHPELISKDFYFEMIHSEALFARKFDGNEDAEVLQLLDFFRLSSESVLPQHQNI